MGFHTTSDSEAPEPVPADRKVVPLHASVNVLHLTRVFGVHWVVIDEYEDVPGDEEDAKELAKTNPQYKPEIYTYVQIRTARRYIS